MTKELSKKSLYFIIPGFLLQFAAFFFIPLGGFSPGLTLLLLFFGTIALIIGFGYFARAKGYSGYMGLLLLLPIPFLGMIILLLLRDKNATEEEKAHFAWFAFLGQIILVIGLVAMGLFFLSQGLVDLVN